MPFCDLHCHSTASDGTVPPEALPQLAQDADLTAIALTDHDTTAGLPLCAAACEQLGVAFVPGIEVSADPALPAPGWPDDPPHGTLHILGLFVRHDDPQLAAVHERMCAARDERNPAIADKLNDLGIDITYAQVEDLAAAQGTKIIGRPHIAQVLIDAGHVATVREAFDRYIGRKGAAYVRRDRLTAADAIDAIHHAGGLAVFAHPVQLGIKEPDLLSRFVRQLRDLGLDGIETRHSDHLPQHVEQFETLAAQLGLLTSGGSDFHGDRKDIALGSERVPDTVHQRLLAAAARFASGT